jgi:glycosyltransferase involved in cell wall biosynthesis
MTLSVMIPTIGRPCLPKVLQELREQLEAGDEVLVIGDGPVKVGAIVQRFGSQFRYLEHGPDHMWGHPQRNHAMPLASGTHLMSLDDDDALLPDSLAQIRAAIVRYPAVPLMFRMRHGPELLWRDPFVRVGNVSTQMFVTPNVQDQLGAWGRRYEGDLDFIASTVGKYPRHSLAWRPEITTVHGIGGQAPR